MKVKIQRRSSFANDNVLDDGRTLAKHEQLHVEIFKKWWNQLKAEMDNIYEGELGLAQSKSASQRQSDLINYANAASKYYNLQAHIESIEFDLKAYEGNRIRAAREKMSLDKKRIELEAARKEYESTKKTSGY